MLFRPASIVLIAAVQLVAVANAKPEFAPPSALTSRGDSDTTLHPYFGRKDAVNKPKLIRGLLMTRQSSCPTGYSPCSDGGCCPTDGSCCGDGCCDAGYYCTTVDGQTGCCVNGEVCTTTGGGCTTSGDLPCPGEDFCCPPGYTCSHDSSGNAQCNSNATAT